MSRTKQIQTRPELPSLVEITSDLESAPSDDVAFTFLRDYTSGTKETKQFQEQGQDDIKESAAKRPRQEITTKPQTGLPEATQISSKSKGNAEVQECYSKVQKFLEMTSYLRDSQDVLAEQCTDLQVLGQSVKDQIESLKTQLHT